MAFICKGFYFDLLASRDEASDFAHPRLELVLALRLFPLVVHGVGILGAQSVRARLAELVVVDADLFLEESDDGIDVRDLRVCISRQMEAARAITRTSGVKDSMTTCSR